MLLARWFHRALKNPTRFWGTVAALAGGILAIVFLFNVVSLGNSANSEVWTKLETAKSPSDRVIIAEDNPQSPAAPWARLHAAIGFYNQGFVDLPNNRDVVLPTLKKALDNFDAVTKTAPADSPQARLAALGKARTLEARNELSKAIEQYEYIAKTWPGSAEGAEAKGLAEALKKPEATAFYKELYAYAPSKATLPPLGTQNFDMPIVPAPPSLGNQPADATLPGMPPTIPLLPPPPPTPISASPKIEEKAKPEAAETPEKPASTPGDAKPAQGSTLPESPFDNGAPTPKAGPSAPAPKAEAPKPSSESAPAEAEKKKS